MSTAQARGDGIRADVQLAIGCGDYAGQHSVSINEDAVLELPEAGLWLVADGMGGHKAGDVASNAIVTAYGFAATAGAAERAAR